MGQYAFDAGAGPGSSTKGWRRSVRISIGYSAERISALATRSSEMAKRRRLGTVPFPDGVECEVFLDEDGRQFVLDGEGDRVYGAGVFVDEPVNVVCGSTRS